MYVFNPNKDPNCFCATNNIIAQNIAETNSILIIP